MRDERLLDYYERELTFLRQLGAEFADSYKVVASRLRLEDNRAEDPHVERLLEGFAFLAARVHLKVDDDFPEISQALLNVVSPHYLRPVPSMSVVQFELDSDQGSLTSGWPLERNTRLITHPTKDGSRFRFRTCYDTTLWPIQVKKVGWHSPHEVNTPSTTDAVAVLKVDLETTGGVSFDELDLAHLRFYLDGEPGLVGSLYELLFHNCTQIVAWNPDKEGRRIRLEGDELRAVGFEPNEGMLPASRKALLPYRLIQEYFTFPKKFNFMDVPNLESVRGAGFGTSMQLLFFISKFERPDRHARLQEGVGDRTLRLGCTPIVNLFPADSRPISLTQRKAEYPVRVHGGGEIFSVEEVYAVSPGTTEKVAFAPFYALRHGREESQDGMFWYGRRTPRGWKEGSPGDMSLAFADLTGRTVHPEYHSASARLLCSNGNLPNELPFGTTASDLHLEEDSVPLQGIMVLTTPTKRIGPPLGGREMWRLISMLSLNHMSLVDQGDDALKEMLRLYNAGDSTSGERHIEGILGVKSSPMHAPVHGEHGLSFARGKGVELMFDEEMFTGAGAYLFASVLERFLALYASLNSFSRLVVRTNQRQEPLGVWPPRAGQRPLL